MRMLFLTAAGATATQSLLLMLMRTSAGDWLVVRPHNCHD